MMDEREKSNSDDAIAALVRHAGRRPTVPQDALRRVRAAVHDEWLEATRRRSRSRWIAATAAALALGIGALVTQRTISRSSTAPVLTTPVIAATVQSIAGGAIGGEGASRHLLDSGAAVSAGEWVETAGSAAASLVWGGATLRLDGGTRVRIVSPRELDLQRGAVYIASDRPTARGAVVRTPLGTVHDIGTQFEVRMAGDRMRVRVREGRIDLQRGSITHSAAAGVELDASPNGGVLRRTIARNGSEWEWVVRAAPPIRLEGLTLAAVVDSVSRDEGVTPVWSDPVARAAASTRLHGSVALAPDEALDSALVAAGLSGHVDGDRLVIRRGK